MKADKLTSNHDISLVDKSLVDIRGDSVRQKKIRESEGVLVEKTCQFLNCRIGEKFFLDDIALAMGTNRSKLAACFKRVLSIGVFEWIRKQRMLKAKSLLLNSDMSIQIIGFEVGYENCANFSTTYKKYFGMSPRQQRK
jgi:AraC-type DNA-binding domain-containing proteins